MDYRELDNRRFNGGSWLPYIRDRRSVIHQGQDRSKRQAGGSGVAMRLINTDLLRNPANWIIVWTMIAFALIGLALVNQVQPGEQ